MATVTNQRRSLVDGLELSQSFLLDQDVVHLQRHRERLEAQPRLISQHFTRSKDYCLSLADFRMFNLILADLYTIVSDF